MTKTEFLPSLFIQYQADKWWEKREISIRELLADAIPNSPDEHQKNCIVDRKEN